MVVWILKLLIFLAEALTSGIIMAKKCPVLAEKIEWTKFILPTLEFISSQMSNYTKVCGGKADKCWWKPSFPLPFLPKNVIKLSGGFFILCKEQSYVKDACLLTVFIFIRYFFYN